MKILVLKGKKENGKTMTLKELIERLYDEYGNSSNLPKQSEISFKDQEYSVIINNKTVRIITLGDYEEYIKGKLSECENDKVDIVVIAERNNFCVVEDFCKSNNYVSEVKQKSVADQYRTEDQCNSDDVDSLISTINSWL